MRLRDVRRLHRVTIRRTKEVNGNLRHSSRSAVHEDLDVYGSRSSNGSRFRRRKSMEDACPRMRERIASCYVEP